MTTVFIEFAPNVTGKVLSDFALTFKTADGTSVYPSGIVMTEMGSGNYSLSANVSSVTWFEMHLVSDPTTSTSGTFEPDDARLNNLDVPVSSRSTFVESSLSDTFNAIEDMIRDIPTNPVLSVDPRLNLLDVAISSRSTYNGGPVQSVLDPVTVGTNSDKDGYSGIATNMVSEPDNEMLRDIKDSIDLIPTNPLLTVDERIDKIAEDASRARKLQSNKAVISQDNQTVTIYDDDGVTVLYIFSVSSDRRNRTPVE